MEFDTASEQSNDLLIEAIKNGVKLLGSRPEFRSFVAEPERSLILDALQPVKSGNRIAISLDSITGNVERLSSVLVPQLLKVRESARVQQDMNNLRQLVLGLLNYESAFDKFPRADGKTEKNPAGLSWRVQILPFIEQGALYKQFKLDEPWDSKNNLPLVKKMPLIYQSPPTKP